LDIACRLSGFTYQFAVNRQLAILVALITVTNLYFFDLYYTSKDFRRFYQVINIIAASSSFLLMLTALAFLSKSPLIGRKFVIICTYATFLLVLVSRMFFSIFHRMYLTKNAVIIGDTPIGRILLKLINAREDTNRAGSTHHRIYLGKKIRK